MKRVIDQLANGERVPAELSMQYEMLRLCSFKSYPKENKPFLIRYAQAGLYYAGKGDEVICYVCRKRFSHWSADDIPIDVHRRNSPNCRFLNNNSEVNVSVGSVENCQKNSHQIFCNKDQTVTALPTETESAHEGACGSSNDMGISNHLDNRPNSFADKSESNSFPNEHTHTDTQHKENLHGNESAKNASCEAFRGLLESEEHQLLAGTKNSQKMLKDLKRENKELRLMTYCSICKTKEVCVVFLPCGHLVSCAECAPEIKNCIYCSRFIKGTVHTYRA